MQEAVAAYVAGSDAAAGVLCAILEGAVRGSVRRLLGDDNLDLDDVVQESLIAVLGYLRRRGGFAGDLISFATTVARNRCRNILNWHARRPHVAIEPLMEWIADPERSPLDVLADEDLRRVLQECLDSLGGPCRDLLGALFVEGNSIEEVRHRIGLETAQGVYYRRSVCLEQLALLLNNRLAPCSKQGDGSA